MSDDGRDAPSYPEIDGLDITTTDDDDEPDTAELIATGIAAAVACVVVLAVMRTAASDVNIITALIHIISGFIWTVLDAIWDAVFAPIIDLVRAMLKSLPAP